jgi:3-hydroxyacyl-CoA dehydrogenase
MRGRFPERLILADMGADGTLHAVEMAERVRARGTALGCGAAPFPTGPIGVCGAGVMGSAIAAAASRAGIAVRLYDISSETLKQAVVRVEREAADHPIPAERPVSNLRSTVTVEPCRHVQELADCDLVIESIPEELGVKQELFAQLAPLLGTTTVLATNTSTLCVERLAASIANPGRFCGLHFCHPVERRPLVEVVPGEGTSGRTVAAVAAFANRLGKLPLVVRDSPGFLINRLLFPYLNEALDLVCRGVPLHRIDQIARRFGMDMGPFELLDGIGIDTALRAGYSLRGAFPARMDLTPILPALVKRGRLGVKAGRGFYEYPIAAGAAERDPAFDALVRPYVRERSFNDEEIAARLILPMLLEATRVLEEGIVEEPGQVDVAVVCGLGFPEARGGLLYWADRMGVTSVFDLLRPFAELGPRMQPTGLLQRLAAKGGRFYG